MNFLLPPNFEIIKYGIKIRLVNENDSDFILNLRTDPTLSKYINHTDSDLEKQKLWINEYKKREKLGEEFYFIFYYNNEPFSVDRIYNIGDTYATAGSWICKPGTDTKQVMATIFWGLDFIFEELNKSEERYDIRKLNKSVIRLQKLLGATKINENDQDIFFILKKDDYLKNRPYLIKLLQIKG